MPAKIQNKLDYRNNKSGEKQRNQIWIVRKRVTEKNLKLRIRNCFNRFANQLNAKKEKTVSKHLKLKVWCK